MKRKSFAAFFFAFAISYLGTMAALDAQNQSPVLPFPAPNVRMTETTTTMAALAGLADGDQISTAGAATAGDGKGQVFRYSPTLQKDIGIASSVDTLGNQIVVQNQPFSVGDKVALSWNTQPTSSPQVTNARAYHVVAADATYIQISETSGGAAVNFSTAGASVLTHMADNGVDRIIADDNVGSFVAVMGGALQSKGDVHAHDGTRRRAIAVGTDGQTLTADSTEAAGVAWTTPASPLARYMLEAGDVSLPNAVAVDITGGSAGQVLSKASGADYDFNWVNQGGGGSGNLSQKGGLEAHNGTLQGEYFGGVSGQVLTRDANATYGFTWQTPAAVQSSVRVFNAVANAVAATDLQDGQSVVTQGYYAANDGSGSIYRFNAAGGGVADGGWIIDVTSGGQLVSDEKSLDVKKFGAKGDGGTDDATAIAAAEAAAATLSADIYFPPGTYVNGSDTVTASNRGALRATTNVNTPSVYGITRLELSGTNTVTNFLNGSEGKKLLVLTGAGVTLQYNANLRLLYAEDFTATANNFFMFEHKGGQWYEINRYPNRDERAVYDEGKGALLTNDGTAGKNTTLAAGTEGQVLRVMAAAPEGLAWQDADSVSDLTTKGDVATYDTSPTRLGVGTDDQVLTADSSAPTGLAWKAAPGSSPLTTKGDLQTFTTENVRLGVGADGQVLTADSAATEGVAWKAGAATFRATDYGVVADGVTDDTLAIQAAIDAAAAQGGGEVILPAGQILVSELGRDNGATDPADDFCLYLKSGVTLSGQGRATELIPKAAPVSNQWIVGINGIDNAITKAGLRNLVIDGQSEAKYSAIGYLNNRTNDQPPQTTGEGIYECFVHDVWVKDMARGNISAMGDVNIRNYDCSGWTSGFHALKTQGGQVTCDGGRWFDSAGNGFDVWPGKEGYTHECTIQNVVMENILSGGKLGNDDSDGATPVVSSHCNLTIRGCTVRNTSSYGIYTNGGVSDYWQQLTIKIEDTFVDGPDIWGVSNTKNARMILDNVRVRKYFKEGTVSSAGNVVTLSGSALPTWAQGNSITAGGETFTIDTVNSPTEFVISGTPAAPWASATYFIRCGSQSCFGAESGGTLTANDCWAEGGSFGFWLRHNTTYDSQHTLTNIRAEHCSTAGIRHSSNLSVDGAYFNNCNTHSIQQDSGTGRVGRISNVTAGPDGVARLRISTNNNKYYVSNVVLTWIEFASGTSGNYGVTVFTNMADNGTNTITPLDP